MAAASRLDAATSLRRIRCFFGWLLDRLAAGARSLATGNAADQANQAACLVSGLE
jgi:hypothetical protein